MNSVKLQLHGSTLKPGAELCGSANWETEADDAVLHLRIGWRTSGTGTEDLEIVDVWETPIRHTGQLEIKRELPVFPYSFSSKLITLTWFIEASIDSLSCSDVCDIIISPQESELHLYATPTS